MAATLIALVAVRSELVENVLDYLNTLAVRAAELPKYYPAHLRRGANGHTGFDEIRQVVQVVKDRRELEQWWVEERERSRRAGQDVERLAYSPRRSRPEAGDREEDGYGAAPLSFPWDDRAGERFHRAVILGDPGFGKTWLLRWEAERLARTATRDLAERDEEVEGLRFPILVRISELNQTDGPVEEVLVSIVGQYRSQSFRSFLRRKLKTGDCVILLDAWDEVPVRDDPADPRSRQELGRRLQMFATAFPQPRLLISSRTVGYRASPIPGAQEVELLAFDARQIECFVRVWFGRTEEMGERFLGMLRQAPQVWGLARIPLMLALMCRAFEAKKLNLPARRVELYEQCLRGLLRDWKREEKGREAISDAYVDGVLDVLRPVSLALFSGGYEQFSESLLREKMMPCLQALKPGHELYGRTAAGLIEELKRDGILILAGEGEDAPLLFLHRTFHEYLAAGALAEKADRKGWRAIASLIDKKSWLPDWEQVIVLLAGQIKDPDALIRWLADQSADDSFRHRLALAVLCSAEMPVKLAGMHRRLIDRATEDLYKLFWSYLGAETLAAVSHFIPAWRAAAQINGRIEGTPLLDLIERHLRSSEESIRCRAVEAVGRMGPPAACPQILDRLITLLGDSEWKVRSGAATALGQIGSAAAYPDMVNSLVQLLWDRDPDVGDSVAEALRQLWPSPPYDVIRGLLESLRDANSYMRSRAANLLGRIGPTAATREVTNGLLLCLSDANEEVRSAAAGAIVRLGAAEGQNDVIDRLARYLYDLEHESEEIGTIRSSAAQAAAQVIAHIGALAATPEVLSGLLECLGDYRETMRSWAATALGNMGPAAAQPEVIAHLRSRMLHDGVGASSAAAVALAKLSAGAKREVLARHIKILRGADRWLDPFVALHEIEELGVASAHPDVVAACFELFRYETSLHIRSAAASAIGRLGIAAAQPEVVACMFQSFRSEQSEGIRAEVAETIGRFQQAGIRVFEPSPGNVRTLRVEDLELGQSPGPHFM